MDLAGRNYAQGVAHSEVFAYLRQWLTDYILTTDMAYKECLSLSGDKEVAGCQASCQNLPFDSGPLDVLRVLSTTAVPDPPPPRKTCDLTSPSEASDPRPWRTN